MTKKELLDSQAFKNAKDDAEIWIVQPDHDECLPEEIRIIRFADGSQNVIVYTKLPPEDLNEIRWLGVRKATKKLNDANIGIHFFGNLFPYLRKKGELKGLFRFNGHHYEYDTDGIIEKARANGFKYKGR